MVSQAELESFHRLVREAIRIQVRAESLGRDIANLAQRGFDECREVADTGELQKAYEADEAFGELEARAKHLLDLRTRMGDIEMQVLQRLEKTPALATGAVAAAHRIEFAEEEVFVQKYLEDPLHSLTAPRHGHWVPEEHWNDRSLNFADNGPLGGRNIWLETGPEYLGSVECILVEPMGKYINEGGFSSAGVVVCLHGLPLYDLVLEEWSQVLKSTRLLDAGFSFAMPDLCASAAVQVEDLEALVIACIAATNASTVILWGKDWGGPQVVRLAASEDPALSGRIAGIVLMAPALPVPQEECEALEIPSLILWAEDDEVNPWEDDSELWQYALAGTEAPVVWVIPETGGHDTANLMQQEGAAADMVLHFTVVVQILSKLARLLKPQLSQKAFGLGRLDSVLGSGRKDSVCLDTSSMASSATHIGWQARERYSALLATQTAEELQARVPERRQELELAIPFVVQLLCEELPASLACQLKEDSERGLAAAMESLCSRVGTLKAASSLSVALRSWLRQGMHEVTAASE